MQRMQSPSFKSKELFNNDKPASRVASRLSVKAKKEIYLSQKRHPLLGQPSIEEVKECEETSPLNE